MIITSHDIHIRFFFIWNAKPKHFISIIIDFYCMLNEKHEIRRVESQDTTISICRFYSNSNVTAEYIIGIIIIIYNLNDNK